MEMTMEANWEAADYWLLRGRQCPFTWRSPVLSEKSCAGQLDKMLLHGTTWNAVLDKLIVAYGYFQNGDRRRGRALLAECYIPMLPTFSPPCDILNDYREALLHVLDSCWAAMALAESARRRAGRDPLLDQFILRIPGFFGFSDKQKAAITLIRALCDGGEAALIDEAIRLNPDEGAWKLHAGWLLEMQRGPTPHAPPPCARELSLLRDAYRLRPSPDTICRLARSLVSDGQSGSRSGCSSASWRWAARAPTSTASCTWPAHWRTGTARANAISIAPGSWPPCKPSPAR